MDNARLRGADVGCVVLLMFVLGATCRAQAVTVSIDFECFALGGAAYADVPQTLVFANVGGSSTTVTIQAHADARIYNMTLFGGSGSQALIDVNWVNYNNPAGTDILFDLPVTNFSLRAGDFGSDDDSPLSITAYDAAGAVIGSATAPWPVIASPPLAMLSLNVGGIRRIHYSSGGSYASSTFIDDIMFDAPLAPPSLAIPVSAAIIPAGGGAPVNQVIGTINVTTGPGSGITGAFTFAAGFGMLDSCYDFQWVNVVKTSTLDCLTQTQSPLSGLIPSIDPSPADGPEPWYYNATEWSSGLFGGNLIRVEGTSSTFIDARQTPGPQVNQKQFVTFLVVDDITTGTIPADAFCVLASFGWTYRNATNDVILSGATGSDPALINTALANGQVPGQPGFPGFPNWIALAPCALDSCASLSASPATISLAAGGTQTFQLNAGPANAGGAYLIAGSLSGTSPGTNFGAIHVPLNSPDAYFTFTLMSPNSWLLPDSLGLLDASGHATAHLVLPSGLPAGLSGIVAHHAYGVVTMGAVTLISNPVSVTLVP